MDNQMPIRQATVQRRAKAAWEHTESVRKSFSDKDKDEYKTRARILPSMIQINGLGSTMVFLISNQDKPAYNRIYTHVSEWVTAKKQLNFDGELISLIRDVDVNTYRRATTEAIEYAIWLKRYVEAW